MESRDLGLLVACVLLAFAVSGIEPIVDTAVLASDEGAQVSARGTGDFAILRDRSRHRADYTVSRGDTMCGIAERLGVSCSALQHENEGRFGGEYRLPVGLRLWIPVDELRSVRRAIEKGESVR